MMYKIQNTTSAVFSKTQQLGVKLTKMHQDGLLEKIPVYKRVSLLRKYKNCLQKLVSVRHPLAKAAMAAGIALLLCIEGNGQAIKYKADEAANPLTQTALPYNIFDPVFVDIDNDGDYDCYAEHYDESGFQFSFLRNNGTKEAPVFALEGTGGFPESSGILQDGPVQGLVFADIDGDGDYDCFIGNYSGVFGSTRYFKNNGTKENPSFELQPSEQNPIGFLGGLYGLYFNLVDIDKDGDYDLYKSSFYYNAFYRNQGTAAAPDFVRERFSDHDGSLNRKFAHTIYTDWNKDGLTDMIKTNVYDSRFKDNVFYKNTGTLTKPKFSKDFQNGPNFPKDFYLYTLVDLNNDGLPEAFSDGSSYAVPSAPETTIDNSNSYAKTITKQTKIKMQVYPNPFFTEFVFRNDNSNNEILMVSITDLSGKTIETITTGSKEIHIGKALKPGIYFLQAIKNHQVIYKQKIVKQ